MSAIEGGERARRGDNSLHAGQGLQDYSVTEYHETAMGLLASFSKIIQPGSLPDLPLLDYDQSELPMHTRRSGDVQSVHRGCVWGVEG